ncbi:MAG: 30S ribosomal protein S9 [Candidatus Eiseniibacteriota bacterium]|nr:MAG: 30S ribosomal protein S9 [Candidatus Eisenbacteria bacterium]
MSVEKFSGTGRRKEAVARVRIFLGSGRRVVNSRSFEEYFRRPTLVAEAQQPMIVTERLDKYDVLARVDGGGLSGQAGAVSLGIARALKAAEPDLGRQLRKEGLLTRNPRMKERKKYGQPGARKRFQFSKR